MKEARRDRLQSFDRVDPTGFVCSPGVWSQPGKVEANLAVSGENGSHAPRLAHSSSGKSSSLNSNAGRRPLRTLAASR